MLCLPFLTHCEYFELNLRPVTSLLAPFHAKLAGTIYSGIFTQTLSNIVIESYSAGHILVFFQLFKVVTISKQRFPSLNANNISGKLLKYLKCICKISRT